MRRKHSPWQMSMIHAQNSWPRVYFEAQSEDGLSTCHSSTNAFGELDESQPVDRSLIPLMQIHWIPAKPLHPICSSCGVNTRWDHNIDCYRWPFTRPNPISSPIQSNDHNPLLYQPHKEWCSHLHTTTTTRRDSVVASILIP